MNKYVQIIMKRKWQISIIILFVSSLIYTFGVGLWITAAKAFPAGIGAYAQLIIYLSPISTRYYSVLIILFNLPLFLIFYKSLNKKMLLYTFCWMVFQFLWAQLIFSFNMNNNIFNIPNNSSGMLLSYGRISYAFIGALFIGLAVGLAFLAGGSSGGTDFLVYYVYQKNKRSFGFLSIVFQFFTIISSIIIQHFVEHNNNSMTNVLFGVTMFITIIYIITYGTIINIMYPRNKKVKIEITSEKIDELIEYLINSKFHHGYSIREERSIYSKKNKKLIITIISYMEVYSFVTNIKKIDPKSWISIIYVKYLFGNFNDKLLDE